MSGKWQPHRSNRLLTTHDSRKCFPNPCCVHRPSDHHMKDWPQHYRDDTGVTERICPHGVGHPDPDQPWPKDAWQWAHGCDGCCMVDGMAKFVGGSADGVVAPKPKRDKVHVPVWSDSEEVRLETYERSPDGEYRFSPEK